MFEDARALPDDEVLRADVCIVGAGAAGITLALRLMGNGLSVLLLESGGFEPEAATQALYEGTMSGLDNWSLHNHRFRRFGGSTTRWAGWCMPLERSDFEPRPHVPLSGWPIGHTDLAPYYELAAERVELGGSSWDAEALAAAEGSPLLPAPSGLLRTRFFRYSPPTRFGTRYREDLEAAEDVRVLLHANTVRLVPEVGSDRIAHLEGAVLDGPRFTVEAETFVLACGGLENARLLLASPGTSGATLANSSGFVGRCFMEHPHIFQSVVWVSATAPALDFYVRRRSEEAGGDVRGVLALNPEVREAEGLLDMTLDLEPVAAATVNTGPLRPSAMSAILGGEPQAWRLRIRGEQSPDPESRVTLGDTLDALGIPRIDLHWTLRDADRVSYRKSAELIGRELAEAGLGRVWSSENAGGGLAGVPGPGAHHMGTTRMSADPSEGVVNANCRCHDVENLYVAGSSVFTTGGSVNPTLTIVALAERLAAHLLEAT